MYNWYRLHWRRHTLHTLHWRSLTNHQHDKSGFPLQNPWDNDRDESRWCHHRTYFRCAQPRREPHQSWRADIQRRTSALYTPSPQCCTSRQSRRNNTPCRHRQHQHRPYVRFSQRDIKRLAERFGRSLEASPQSYFCLQPYVRGRHPTLPYASERQGATDRRRHLPGYVYHAYGHAFC